MRLPRWRRGHDPLVCREFVELVSDYLDETLPSDERVRFEAHIAECNGCVGYLQDMGHMVDSIGALAPPPPDPATREALLRALHGLRPPEAS